jgi:hypothetical protein
MSDPVTDSVTNSLHDLIGAERELRKSAETKADEARTQLVRVAIALCRTALDEAQQASPQGVAEWTAKQLADLIIDAVGRLLDDMDLSEAGLGAAYHKAAQEIEHTKQQVNGLQDELNRTSHELELASAQNHALEQAAIDLRIKLAGLEQQRQQLLAKEQVYERRIAALSATTPADPKPETSITTLSDLAAEPQIAPPGPPRPSLPETPIPLVPLEWIQSWQKSPTYEREAALVKLMGDTGECRRNKLADELAQQLSIQPRSASIGRYIQNLADAEVISIQETARIARGSAPEVLLLTEKGRDIYRSLFGREPTRVYDRLLARHKSVEHLYLNLETADLLRAEGYAVDLEPSAITLADGSKFMPDLIASKDSETQYVECERETRKNDLGWVRKWEIVLTATQGDIRVVTPDKAAMRALGSCIQFALGERNLKLFMTNLDDWRKGDRGKGGSFWLVQPSQGAETRCPHPGSVAVRDAGA